MVTECELEIRTSEKTERDDQQEQRAEEAGVGPDRAYQVQQGHDAEGDEEVGCQG